MRVLRNVLLLCNLAVLLLTLMAYLAPHVPPEKIWFLQFAGMAYPFLLLLNIAFAFVWLFLRKRYFIISLIVILLGWSHVTNFVGFSLISKIAPTSAIKILTYNVDNFSSLLKGSLRERRKDDFEKFITAEQPDIICLQESFITSAEYKNRINQFPALAAYPYIFHPEEKGIAIFSKFPAARSAKIIMKEDRVETANGANYADFQIRGKTMRLVITHLQSNSVRERTEDVIEDKFRSNTTRRTALNVIRKIRDMSYFRASQSESIRRFIQKSPHPVIIAGDFNDTPQSYTYNQISSGLKDAFAEKGCGLGVTYGGIIPGLRIDYILVDPSLEVLSCKIPKVPFSDHYPVVAEIAFP